MKDRPEIEQRIRVLGNTGVKGVVGRAGRVIGHYPDGVAFRVRLEDGDRRELTCDPVNVEPAPING
jgi:hypothetical protein